MFIIAVGMLIPFILAILDYPSAEAIVDGMRHGNFSYAILIVSLAMFEASLSNSRRKHDNDKVASPKP